MRLASLVVGSILFLSGLLAAADAPSAEEAADMLKARAGTFLLNLDYVGKENIEVPRMGVTLTAGGIKRDILLRNHFDLIIDKRSVRPIVDALLAQGILEQATRWTEEQEAKPAKLEVPCYRLTVSGGGVTCEADLGWGPELYKRIEKLEKEIKPADGSASKGLGVVLGSLRDLKDATPTAPAAADAKPDPAAEKLKAGVEKGFTLSLDWQGKGDPAKPVWGVTLSTQPVERLASVPNHTDVVIDAKTAAKLVDALGRFNFFGRVRAEQLIDRAAITGYQVQVVGAGERFVAFLDWDRFILRPLGELRAALDGDAGKAMDKVLESVRAANPEAVEYEKLWKLSRERADKLEGDIANFALELSYVGEQTKPFYGLTLSVKPMLRDGVRTCWEEAVIDPATAKKIVESLAESCLLGRAEDLALARKERPLPAGPCYVMTISGGELRLRADLGWGKDLALELFRLRGLLAGEPGKKMDVLLGRLSGYLKEWTGEGYPPAK